MQLAVWLALGSLSVLSVLQGRVQVALMLAGLKALLVGLEFMELRHAARVHAAGYVLFVAFVVVVLQLLA